MGSPAAGADPRIGTGEASNGRHTRTRALPSVAVTPEHEVVVLGLFVSSDEPTLKALRFYMRHGRTTEGDVALIS